MSNNIMDFGTEDEKMLYEILKSNPKLVSISTETTKITKIRRGEYKGCLKIETRK